MALIAELKRRNVIRAAGLYLASAWLVVQVAGTILPMFLAPAWLPRTIVIVLAIGFVPAMIIAWVFELTPQGLKRDADVAPDQSIDPLTTRRMDQLLLVISVLAIAYFAFDKFALAPRREAALVKQTTAHVTAEMSAEHAKANARSIAVLPFENLSEDKGNKYFADGMQDLILTKLADVGELKVISRTSTMKYASHPDDLKTIAQQLDVATILEGSVQKSGNQVLINVQLIDAKTDAHLWAQSYQRTLDNVFGVEGEVAGQIATALKAKLSPAETQRLATALSTDPAANDLFLRAEYFANQGQLNVDFALVKQAIPLYRQAIAKAPDFALARARLSNVESFLGFNFGAGEDVQQLKTDARAQAEQALALAPDLVEAQLAIGYCDLRCSADYGGALTTFAAVLNVRPNDAEALAGTGYVLRRIGRFEDAIKSLQQALVNDPRNSLVTEELGKTYLMVSRYIEAKAEIRHALALDPTNITAKRLFSQIILFANGDVAGAWSAAQGDVLPLQLWRVDLLTYQRMYQDALALLASIPDTPDNFSANGRKALQQADLYRLAGDEVHAKPLFAVALPLVRAQLKGRTGSDRKEAYVWSLVADAEMGLGHTAAGMAAIGQSQALLTRVNDHLLSANFMVFFASLYAEANDPDLAVPLLEKVLDTPGIGWSYSPVLLWLDPGWDPIRLDPRFEALLKKYASAKPALVKSEVAP